MKSTQNTRKLIGSLYSWVTDMSKIDAQVHDKMLEELVQAEMNELVMLQQNKILETVYSKCDFEKDFIVLGFTIVGHLSDQPGYETENERDWLYKNGVVEIAVRDLGNTHCRFIRILNQDKKSE